MHSSEIVHETRKKFEALLSSVMEEPEEKTAHAVESNLLKGILALGRQLLMLFFTLRNEKASREKVETVQGQKLPYYQDRCRIYYSVFGKVQVWRPYFYKVGVGSMVPLDAQLGLGTGSYSDLWRQMHERLSVYVSYEKAGELLGQLLGHNLSNRPIQKSVIEDSSDVKAFYEQLAPAETEPEATILVAQGDGKGVPMRQLTDSAKKARLGKGEKRSRKKEAVVTTTYTIEPNARTGKMVADSLVDNKQVENEGHKPPRPCNKRVWATLEGKQEAIARLKQQTDKLDNPHIIHRVCLCDGDQSLQTQLTTQLPDFTLVLDIIHLLEYLWKVANALWPHDSQRQPWVKQQLLHLLNGEPDTVLTHLDSLSNTFTCGSPQHNALSKTAGYITRNRPYIDYHLYLQRGWPIASGAIEGACRHLVKDRMELSGMRWCRASAESMLALRAVSENGDWDAYHTFHQYHRQQRLYQHYPASLQPSAFHSLPLAG